MLLRRYGDSFCRVRSFSRIFWKSTMSSFRCEFNNRRARLNTTLYLYLQALKIAISRVFLGSLFVFEGRAGYNRGNKTMNEIRRLSM